MLTSGNFSYHFYYSFRVNLGSLNKIARDDKHGMAAPGLFFVVGQLEGLHVRIKKKDNFLLIPQAG